MNLDSRSCKLLAIFAPWCTEISLPFELGVEDALAFRLPPVAFGAPLRWYRQVNNLRDKGITKSNLKIDSGDGNDEYLKELTDLCYKVALYDPESRNEEDQWDQKELWIKMHESAQFYSQSAFREGLNAEAFIHHDGVTHKCMTFLQSASTKVDRKGGIWRLWDKPLAIGRASEILPKNEPKIKT